MSGPWTGDSLAPQAFDWAYWNECWDRMQERYLVQRAERFAVIERLLRGALETVSCVVDLGCGAGTLTAVLCETYPEAQVWGVDFDPAMLALARARLARYGDGARLILADLRAVSWPAGLPASVDAVVSATALHWLTPAALAALYARVAALLRPGGLFLNADHVGSGDARIQHTWERHRAEMRAREGHDGADDWDGFWARYARALEQKPDPGYDRVLGGWEGGVEEGLALTWHLDTLRAVGFRDVDCFWRGDCDAIYGGVFAGGSD